MKTWIAKIRITDDGWKDADKKIQDYLTSKKLEEQLLGQMFDMAGIEITNVISIEEEIEVPKD